ncbi:4-hydroxy-tetrahydrodipicolinate synthase [Puniceicoccaceae bacterium K14]|nr:4-hydroxy-tetrahydrodipicolinate synthase [Puniceicoccaceae bacterium K14]
MINRRFTGSITALATPFDSNGELALNDLGKLVEAQITAGINGLLPVGTTGESPTLNHNEHKDVIAFTIEAAKGRVPIIAGAGSNSTREAVSLTKHAHEAGADATLHVAPYYNKPSAEGLFRHFSAVAEATDKTVILYSIPGRCGIDIPVNVVERLRNRYPHVDHIKEAGGSVDRVDQLKNAMGDDIVVLSGDDSLTLPFIAAGAEGTISVASNVLPDQVVSLVNFALDGNLKGASELHRRLNEISNILFIEPNPVPVKACLKALGLFQTDRVRLPLCEMGTENHQRVSEAFQAVLRSTSTVSA